MESTNILILVLFLVLLVMVFVTMEEILSVKMTEVPGLLVRTVPAAEAVAAVQFQPPRPLLLVN